MRRLRARPDSPRPGSPRWGFPTTRHHGRRAPPRRGRRSGDCCALALAGGAAASNSWRCGNRLVHDGATRSEIVRICGAPSDRNASVEYRSARLRSGEEILQAVLVEVWTYNRGPRQFIRYLTFRDGLLDDVSEGGYGY
jgi:hypothetical protein